MTITKRESDMQRLRIVGAMRTDVGRVRSANEDTVVFVAPAEGSAEGKLGYLALVADGMGGHAAGEVASSLAAEVIRRIFYSADASPPQALNSAFAAANQVIFDHAALNSDFNGMGTTCTAIAIRDDRLWLAHVGDTRAYLLRDGALAQLSDDQTLHAQLVRDGVMTAEEAAKSPGGNIILQALGPRQAISPTIWAEGRPLRRGDTVFLCSDGLYDLVDDDDIARIISGRDPLEACRELIERALAGGGHDNISVGVFRIVDTEPRRTDSLAATKPILVAEADANASARTSQIIVPLKV
jgi:serine/threonine protein phosphatase PrpC